VQVSVRRLSFLPKGHARTPLHKRDGNDTQMGYSKLLNTNVLLVERTSILIFEKKKQIIIDFSIKTNFQNKQIKKSKLFYCLLLDAFIDSHNVGVHDVHVIVEISIFNGALPRSVRAITIRHCFMIARADPAQEQ
jgi:hypothetical protein